MVGASILLANEVADELVSVKVVVLPKILVATAFFKPEKPSIELTCYLDVVDWYSQMKWLYTHQSK